MRLSLLLCVLLCSAALSGAGEGKRDVRREDLRREGALKVGDAAPDFSLASPDGKTTLALSTLLKNQKPVVLVFGSYT